MGIIGNRRKFKSEIRRSKNIFIMAHKDLDLDAIGSSLGMYSILKKQRKNCFLIIDDKDQELGVKKILREIEGSYNIIKSKTIPKYLYKRESKNLLLILDTNKKELVQSEEALDYFTRKVVLDHHELGKTSIEAGLIIVDNEISSTCEMITELIDFYDVELDPFISTVLLSGIVLDTNNFTLKTNTRTYYAAYYLAKIGASAKKVQYLMKQDLEDYTERQKLLAGIEIIDNKIAFTKGTPYVMYRREDLAKMADILLFFNDIEASFVIGKIGKDSVGISARSLGNYDITTILEALGGGGDNYNGAAKIENIAISKVEEQLKKEIKKQEGVK